MGTPPTIAGGQEVRVGAVGEITAWAREAGIAEIVRRAAEICGGPHRTVIAVGVHEATSARASEVGDLHVVDRSPRITGVSVENSGDGPSADNFAEPAMRIEEVRSPQTPQLEIVFHIVVGEAPFGARAEWERAALEILRGVVFGAAEGVLRVDGEGP